MGQTFDYINIKGDATPGVGLSVKNQGGDLASFDAESMAHGVNIKNVHGKENALAIYKNKTSISALWVNQEGTGNAASFEGGSGVDITGVSGKRNALNVYDNQTEYPTVAFINNGSGAVLSVRQEGSGDISWFRTKTSKSKLVISHEKSDIESISLSIYQAEKPVWKPTNNLSDLTLAENVTPIKNALDKVLSLEGVSFSWQDKALGEGKEIGVSAEKVGEVLPELVHSADGESGLVKYDKFVPVLIEAIKAQQKQIEQLQQEIQSLKGQGNNSSNKEFSEQEYVPDF